MVLRGRPAHPGDSGPGPRALGVDHLPDDLCPTVIACGFDKVSLATQASVRGPAMSTSSPGQLTLGSEVLWGRPGVPGYLGYCPRSRLVHQHPRETRARVRGPAGLTSCPGRIRPLSQGPRSRPAVPGDSGPGPRAHGVDQISMATWACVPVPAISTSSPRQIRPVSLGPRCQPAAPGDSGPGPRSCRIEEGGSHLGPKVHGVDQLSRAIGVGSDGLQSRPAVLEDVRQALMARRLDHMSRGTWGHVPVPGVSNSSPRRLGAVSDGP